MGIPVGVFMWGWSAYISLTLILSPPALVRVSAAGFALKDAALKGPHGAS